MTTKGFRDVDSPTLYGTGAPSGSGTSGRRYFDQGTTPWTEYVWKDGAWNQTGGATGTTGAKGDTGAAGPNNYALTLRADDLVGSDGKIYGIVSPVAGTISKIWASLEQHALATGNATLTGKIGTTAITGGVVSITQVASAVGDVHSATPSAANVVVAGDRINFTVGGTNDNTAAQAQITIQITP